LGDLVIWRFSDLAIWRFGDLWNRGNSGIKYLIVIKLNIFPWFAFPHHQQ